MVCIFVSILALYSVIRCFFVNLWLVPVHLRGTDAPQYHKPDGASITCDLFLDEIVSVA